MKKQPAGAQTIIEKVGTGGLVAESHPATEQLQATTAYRYAGANPDNYVDFNNELWRIIGVFETDDGTGKLEKRIKLIRNESIGKMPWDSSNNSDWTKASGMTLLNSGDYWNQTGKYLSNGLTTEAKSQIANAKWYLGAEKNAANSLANYFYSYERGKTVYSSSRPTSWLGKVGLMYPSDYGYATNGGNTKSRDKCLITSLNMWNNYSDCHTNNWLYDSSNTQWTLMSDITKSSYSFVVSNRGSVSGLSYVSDYYVFRPCVYLLSNIKITGGSGTQSDPYQLSL